MRSSIEYSVEEVHINAKKPLLEKKILFDESYETLMNGECRSLLHAIAEDPFFADWEIYWTLPGDIYLEQTAWEKYGDRMELLLRGGTKYREILLRAQIVVTSGVLPFYFIKHEGQCVVTFMDKGRLQVADTPTRNRARTHKTLNDSDIVYLTGGDSAGKLLRRYCGGEPHFQCIEGSPLSLHLKSPESFHVVISLSNAAIGNSFPSLEELVKGAGAVISEENRSFCVRIPNTSYARYEEENAVDVSEHIISDIDPLFGILGSCELFISNSINETAAVAELGIPCICLTNSHDRIAEEEGYREGRIRIAGDRDEVFEQLHEIYAAGLQRKVSISAEKDGCRREELVSAMKAVAAEEKKTGPVRLAKDLVLISGNAGSLAYETWPVFGRLANRDRIEVLFRETGRDQIWDTSRPFPEEVPLYCRTGGSAGREILEEEGDFAREFRRIVGDVSYESIKYVGKPSPFWDAMLAASAAGRVEYLGDREFVNFLVSETKGSGAGGGDEEGADKLRVRLIDGEPYTFLGSREDDVYFVPGEKSFSRLCLAFSDRRTDPEELIRLAEEDPGRTVVILDPEKRLKEDRLSDRDNVLILQTGELPLSLFHAAEELAFCADDTLRMIGAAQGKVIFPEEEEQEEKRGKINRNISILCENMWSVVDYR